MPRMMKTMLLSVLYFLTGIAYIILEPHISFYPELALKALIIPVLIIIFVLNLKPPLNRLCNFMLAGLFCSWAGDIILDYSFIPGLLCFLTAHIMYLTAFFLTPGRNMLFRNRKWLLIPVILCGAGLICFLWDDLNEMRIPVIVYALVILTMLSAAINRMEKVKRATYWLVLSGAVLFLISDSAIAINKFSFQLQSETLIVMSTYITAQYLIITGFIMQIREGEA
jgi:uncharacterized membrane protein YhhN